MERRCIRKLIRHRVRTSRAHNKFPDWFANEYDPFSTPSAGDDDDCFDYCAAGADDEKASE